MNNIGGIMQDRMEKWIEYSDPHPALGDPDWVEIIHRVRWQDAARIARYIHKDDPRGNLYESDDDAAEDFMAIHWGRIIYL